MGDDSFDAHELYSRGCISYVEYLDHLSLGDSPETDGDTDDGGGFHVTEGDGE